MAGRMKILVVVAGYGLALGAAAVAGWLYDLRVSKLPYDTSGGMYAGGQMLTVVGVFLVVALVPTALGLWFLRRHERAWHALAITSLVFAVCGLVVVLAPQTFGAAPRSAPLELLELFGLAQFLGVPLWFGAFALFALLAPTRKARRTLALAVACETAIGVCALMHLLLPGARL